jgi:hypothetical protein
MADLIIKVTGLSRRRILWDDDAPSSQTPPPPESGQTEESPFVDPDKELWEFSVKLPKGVNLQPFGPTKTNYQIDPNRPCEGINMGETLSLKEAVKQDRKIAAIKIIRTVTGLGLKEAKDAFEENVTAWKAGLTKAALKAELQAELDEAAKELANANKDAKVEAAIHQAKTIPAKNNFVVKHSGNGHKSNFKRKLVNLEKDAIRAEFLSINGCGTEDHWVVFRKNNLSAEVTIFQVTGFVSYLHRDVAAHGKTMKQLPDFQAYLKWLKNQYGLWKQYNSAKYEGYRQKNSGNKDAHKIGEINTAEGPKFTNEMPPNMKYA